MKTSFIRTIFFVIIMLLAISVNAQEYPDYVITASGDSIPCNISIPLFGAVRYQGVSMAKAEKIKPDVIKEYYIVRRNNRQRAVFKENSTKPIFMKVIEKGKISLYQLITTYTNTGYGGVTTTSSTTTWFIGKGSDSVIEFKTTALFASKSRKERKDDFGEMLKDNQVVYDKYIAEDKFSFTQIHNLVHLYNTGQPLNE